MRIIRQRYQPIETIAKTKALRLCIIAILTTLLIIGFNQFTYAQAWFNPSWGFRKSHLITGSAGAGTNYQVRVIVHKATGTDVTSDVYLGTNVRDDFGDVRFTASDGTTLLSYWMETGSLVSGSQAAFWVEVAADLGSNQTIYVYYGNGSATTTSNGVNTFILFDDFDGGTLDGSKWTRRNGNAPAFAGGLMTVSANGIDPSKIIATGGPTANNNAIVARFKVTAGTNADERAGVGVRTTNSTAPQGFNYLLHNFSALNEIKFLDDATAWGAGNFGSWSKNTFYTMEIFHDGTNVRGRINFGTWNTQAWTTRTGTTYLALNIGSFDGTTVWDWAFIRKAIATEPANSTWGAEQTAPPAITGFLPTGACQGIAGIVITGTNFTGATAVTFNGVSTSYTVNNATQITATVPLSATTGIITVTAPAGIATSLSSFTVNVLPTASATKTDISCFNANNGTITVSGHGGSGSYTYYSITNGLPPLPGNGYSTNPVFTPLVPGQYQIRVIDNNGCESKSVQ